MEESEKQHCPICSNEVIPMSRYSNYICDKCIKEATDGEGRKVVFGNTNVLGHGCQGKYRATDEEYETNICFIKGMKCKAQEAYFGGIVIQPV